MSDEWGQLKLVSARLDDLTERRLFAQKIGQIDRVRALAREIITVQAERDRVVGRIMTRLSDAR
jgi:hypothetical protein